MTPALRGAIAGAAVVAMIAAGAPVRANAASASLSLSPARVGIGKPATLVGRHLQPGRYYTFVLAVPDAAKPKVRYILPVLAKANASGNLRASFRMPIVVRCGRATVYGSPAGSVTAVVATFRLTGCKASGNAPPPPAPPGGSKHGH